MINEEGGIDPEQFRMEAMFDRMDAIGKSVLGLTIQCAQCHNHKYDPLTQEEYYRMFAFLNNTHEANVAVYTPDEQMKRAEIFRKIREIEAELKHQHPDWRERMAALGEARSADDQPDWVVVRPEVDDESTAAARSTTCWRTARSSRQGYAPTKHTTEFTALKTDVQTDHGVPPRAAQRPEPAAAAVRAGRSRGPCALTEFDVEAAPADKPGQKTRGEVRRAPRPTSIRPRQPLEPIFDDRSGTRRVTGPIAFAIDGKDETAWGIDAGPGRRNVPRKAVFVAREADRLPGGHDPDVQAQPEPRRLEQRRQPEQQPRPVPALGDRSRRTPTADPLPAARPRDPGDPARAADARPGRRRLQLLADDRPGVEGGQRPDRGALEAASRRARRSWCSSDRERPARDAHARARRFPQAGKAVEPGVPAFLNPLPAGSARRPADLRPLAGRPPGADDGPVARQPGLAGLLRHRARQHQRGPRLAVRAAVASRAARLAGRRVHGQRLEPQAPAPADRRPRPPIGSRRGSRPSCWRATRTTACWPAGRGSGSTPRSSATSPWRPAGCSNRKVGGAERLPAGARRSCSSRRPATARRSGTRRPEPDRYRRALYTFRYRSVPYPMLQTFDAPNGDFSCVRRTRSNTPLQALTTLNEPIFLECARALALPTLKEGGDTDADRLTYAFRRCLARPARRRGDRTAAGLALHARPKRFASRRGRTRGTWPPTSPRKPPASRHRDPRPARRLDRRRPRAA